GVAGTAATAISAGTLRGTPLDGRNRIACSHPDVAPCIAIRSSRLRGVRERDVPGGAPTSSARHRLSTEARRPSGAGPEGRTRQRVRGLGRPSRHSRVDFGSANAAANGSEHTCRRAEATRVTGESGALLAGTVPRRHRSATPGNTGGSAIVPSPTATRRRTDHDIREGRADVHTTHDRHVARLRDLARRRAKRAYERAGRALGRPLEDLG